MVVAWSFWVDVSEHLGPRGLLEARRSWQLGRGSWGVLSALTRALEGPYPITTWGRVNLATCNPLIRNPRNDQGLVRNIPVYLNDLVVASPHGTLHIDDKV